MKQSEQYDNKHLSLTVDNSKRSQGDSDMLKGSIIVPAQNKLRDSINKT